MAKMEVKTSLLDNMIGVGDMVLLEPLTEESFISNLQQRFDHSEIYPAYETEKDKRFGICVLANGLCNSPVFIGLREMEGLKTLGVFKETGL
uniref:Uncharacterized protein n=1 Tax=Sphaerodactylus townsendi TaxID=933632 RepID=A0ACB8G099_9SAUR